MAVLAPVGPEVAVKTHATVPLAVEAAVGMKSHVVLERQTHRPRWVVSHTLGFLPDVMLTGVAVGAPAMLLWPRNPLVAFVAWAPEGPMQTWACGTARYM